MRPPTMHREPAPDDPLGVSPSSTSGSGEQFGGRSGNFCRVDDDIWPRDLRVRFFEPSAEFSPTRDDRSGRVLQLRQRFPASPVGGPRSVTLTTTPQSDDRRIVRPWSRGQRQCAVHANGSSTSQTPAEKLGSAGSGHQSPVTERSRRKASTDRATGVKPREQDAPTFDVTNEPRSVQPGVALLPPAVRIGYAPV